MKWENEEQSALRHITEFHREAQHIGTSAWAGNIISSSSSSSCLQHAEITYRPVLSSDVIYFTFVLFRSGGWIHCGCCKTGWHWPVTRNGRTNVHLGQRADQHPRRIWHQHRYVTPTSREGMTSLQAHRVNIQGGYDVNTGMLHQHPGRVWCHYRYVTSTSREGMMSLQVCNINNQGGYDVTTGM